MADRSSRPRVSPRRTPTRIERRIIKVRLARRWGPARIAGLLHLNASTVHRVLTRYGLARLAHLDRPTGRVIRRYERAAPGELVHVDIKKLGNIPDGGGHKAHGRPLGSRNSTAAPRSPTTAPARAPNSATATYTTPSTTTPGWPTPRSCPTRPSNQRSRSGGVRKPSSPVTGSP
jgi:hypothetical protein